MLIIGGQKISYSVNKHKTIAVYVAYCWQLMMTNATAQQESVILPSQQLTHTELKQALTRFLVNSSNQPQGYQAIFQRWLLPKSTHSQKIIYAPNQPQSNSAELMRSYRHWYEVGLALDGWFSSKKRRKQEQELAQSNYQNPYLAVLLNSIIHKLYEHINGLKQEDSNFKNTLTMELLSGQTVIRSTSLSSQLQPATSFGRYNIDFIDKHSNNTPFISTKAFPLQVLKDPQQYSITDKIITLHDMSEYFGEQQAKTPETAGQWLLSHAPLHQLAVSTYAANGHTILQVSLIDNEIVERGTNRKLLGVGDNNYCRDESVASTLLARNLGLPLCSGHSISASNILNMAVLWGKCNEYELTALSHALAAFWCLEDRPNNNHSSHTLHEVFDIAKNFGVRYTLSREANGNTLQVVDKITMGYLCQCVDDIYIDIKTLLDDTEKDLLLINHYAELKQEQPTTNLYGKWQQVLEEKRHTAKKLTNLIGQILCQYDEYVLPTSSMTVTSSVSYTAENNIIAAVQPPMYKLLGILKYVENLAQLTRHSLLATNGQVAPTK
ncbi:MAG: hypothetical protein ACI9LM_003755 [Alteromonadaceae bacterium]|jgi:hypothetical protein